MKMLASEYMRGIKETLDKMSFDGLEEMMHLMLEAYENERSIFVMGNGGSGSTAAHFACDLNKGVSFGLEKRFKAICLNDNVPVMLAYANDVSYSDVFVEQLKNFLKEDDVVIGLSGSGNSLNVLKAIDYANAKGAKTVGLSGFDGGKLALIVGLPLVVESHDMQKVEDIHLIMTHVIMQFLRKWLYP
ncbi:MAG: SIS domain-containing protein [Candidatus Brocadia sinica]|nr:SIS domain-containing protein [Candidatus Brocadia sinica]